MSSFKVLTRVYARALVRDRTALIFTFILPIAFLAVFGLVFGSQKVSGTEDKTIDYLGPGILCYGVANSATIGVALNLATWRRNGLLRAVRMTPTPLGAVLGARLVVSLGVATVQTLLFGAVAMLPVFGLDTDPLRLLAGLVAVLAGTTVFFMLGLLIGTVVGTSEAVTAVCNFVLLPMAFMSGSFIPLRNAPHWLQDFSRTLPLRYMNTGVSQAVTGGATLRAMGECVVLAGFAAVLAAIVTRTFRWGAGS